MRAIFYATGSFDNKTNFGDTGAPHIFDPNSNFPNLFVMKLDPQKQLQWIKHLSAQGGHAYIAGYFIKLDQNQNVIVTGSVQGIGANPDIVLNPGNISLFEKISTNESGDRAEV